MNKPHSKGNSPAAVAGRAARKVRAANAWKVKAGRLSRKQLAKSASAVERQCRAEPEAFRHWSGVFRREGGA